ASGSSDWLVSLRPIAFYNAAGADFDSQWVALQFRHQREMVHGGGDGDVGVEPEAVQLLTAASQVQGRAQHVAVRFKTVPGKAGRIVQPQFEIIAQELDECAGEHGVLEARLALAARTHDMQ